ncbi:uncharacterized protein LOC115072137 isoform X2 [Nannospalax galili]|uniref:uncharacterized protein LOC115072137 isoform X2 n=1 Tax=Nannospalax galili TaxID=1026970 RepID=UPI00111C51D4|nr:uncharacterized protein LOC115072137 isoform X2 [Nannospalax galili]
MCSCDPIFLLERSKLSKFRPQIQSLPLFPPVLWVSIERRKFSPDEACRDWSVPRAAFRWPPAEAETVGIDCSTCLASTLPQNHTQPLRCHFALLEPRALHNRICVSFQTWIRVLPSPEELLFCNEQCLIQRYTSGQRADPAVHGPKHDICIIPQESQGSRNIMEEGVKRINELEVEVWCKTVTW